MLSNMLNHRFSRCQVDHLPMKISIPINERFPDILIISIGRIDPNLFTNIQNEISKPHFPSCDIAKAVNENRLTYSFHFE